jgi:hypothetical protein
MYKIGKKVSMWVISQTDLAKALGMTSPSINSMLNGKKRLPFNRFLQIVHQLNPPQNEVDEVFNLYLNKFELPVNSFRIRKNVDTVQVQQQKNKPMAIENKPMAIENVVEVAPIVNPVDINVVSAIIDAVMASDIDDTAKVKVYNIAKEIKDSRI